MAPALVLTLIILLLFGATLWAGVDAAFQPESAWRAAGIDRRVTSAILVVSCALGAVYYFAFVRPRLVRTRYGRSGA
jgi:TRAP-type C4-dicarboxylate transport system permease small subunit